MNYCLSFYGIGIVGGVKITLPISLKYYDVFATTTSTN